MKRAVAAVLVLVGLVGTFLMRNSQSPSATSANWSLAKASGRPPASSLCARSFGRKAPAFIASIPNSLSANSYYLPQRRFLLRFLHQTLQRHACGSGHGRQAIQVKMLVQVQAEQLWRLIKSYRSLQQKT